MTVVKKDTLLSLIEQCRSINMLKQIHGLSIVMARAYDVFSLSRLIDFCVNSEDLVYARSIFVHVHRPTIYMWNAMIRGLSGSREPSAALSSYKDMQQLGHSPDNFTFPFVLKACSSLANYTIGKCVHARIIKTGFDVDIYVSSTLIHMYVSCHDTLSARSLFESVENKNVVSWTTMIAGYIQNNQCSNALTLFKQMKRKGVQPNEITLVHVLVACAENRDLETGKQVHAWMCRVGSELIQSNIVLATALVDMYARCGSLNTARHLFDGMLKKNEVSWNSIITAYNQYGQPDEVFHLFKKMCNLKLKPDNITMLSVLSACVDKGSMVLGQVVHAYIEKTIGIADIALSTSLINMYAKTGNKQSALFIFESSTERDVMAWTSMILGLAMHGHCEEALEMFKRMQLEGVAPDQITFIGVLTACSHAGMVDEGKGYLNMMENQYGIKPTVDHYCCIVDLLIRAGRLTEAKKFVETMPFKPNIAVWVSLLSGCEIHRDISLAEDIGDQVAEFDLQGTSTCVLLSNIYASLGKWQEVEMTRKLMWRKGLNKVQGYSFVS